MDKQFILLRANREACLTMGNVFFSADFHFEHLGMLKLGIRQFASIEEHDECIMDGINSTVQRGDELICAGDFCWHASRAGHFRARIKPHVQLHMVVGNHDAASLAKHCSSFQQMMWRKFKGVWFHICHYPLWSWRNMHAGAYHLYGHSHGSSEDALDKCHPGRRSMDIGVDVAKRLLGVYRPFSLDEVFHFINVKASDAPIGSDH